MPKYVAIIHDVLYTFCLSGAGSLVRLILYFKLVPMVLKMNSICYILTEIPGGSAAFAGYLRRSNLSHN